MILEKMPAKMRRAPDIVGNGDAEGADCSNPLSYDEAYAVAFVEATIAVEAFERDGHGLQLWLAYQSMRRAQAAWPAQTRALKSWVMSREPRPSEELAFTTTALDCLRDRVMGHVDQHFQRLIALKVVSDAGSGVELRRALQIEGKKAPRASKASDVRAKIVEQVQFAYRVLFSLQDAWGGSLGMQTRRLNPPPSTEQHIFKIVAKAVQKSVPHVRAVWKEFVQDGDGKTTWSDAAEVAKSRDAILRTKRAGKPEKRAVAPIATRTKSDFWRGANLSKRGN